VAVGVAMHDIDLRGSNYTGLKLGSGDAAACQNACRADTRVERPGEVLNRRD
jgi:hypothetical protein